MADKSQTEPAQPVPPQGPGDRRRRGHRGGRGRGRHRAEQISQAVPPAGAPALPEQSIETAVPAISRAIEEVTQIVESLKHTLDQMEEVLELVEVAERQKTADEREIESLRQALRRIHQPRGEPRERPPSDD